MKIYTQCILWSYILLPTICILLSPTLILGIARAQQQRAKFMANAMNARAKAAAALARNQARNYQNRLVPNRFSNGVGQNFFKSRTSRDANSPMAMDRKTNWDQQDESMGQLQNMWNMNNFGNVLNDGFLQDTHIDEDREGNQMVGNPRVYVDKKRESGAFFGRNVYDDIVGAAAGVVAENDATLPLAKSADPEPTLSKLKRKKKQKMGNNPSFYYPQNYYSSYNPYFARSDREEEPQPAASREMTPLFQKTADPEPTLKKIIRKKLGAATHHHPQSYHQPGPYYGKSAEVFEFEPIQGQFNSEPPPEFSQRESGRHQQIKVKKNKGNAYSSSFHGNHDMVGSGNTNIPEEMIFDEPNLAAENIPPVDAPSNPQEARTSADFHRDHSEDVGCEFDDKLDKKPNHQTFDPYAYYERTMNELTELNKKIAKAGKSVIPTPNEMGHVDGNPAAPELLPQVSYITSEDDGVGSVHDARAFEEKSALPNPDPHLHSHSFSHTHTHVHSHQKTFGKGKTFYSTPIVGPTVYGTSPAVVYPHVSISKAEAHAKAETYNRGDIAQTGSASGISHAAAFGQDFGGGRYQQHEGRSLNSGGFGQSGTQASFAPGGFVLPSVHATAQAASQSFNSGGAAKSFSQAASGGVSHQNFATRGFVLPSAQATAEAASQNFNSGGAAKSFSQAASQAVSHQNFATGGFGQPSAQATAEAASQNFNSGGAAKSFSQAVSGGVSHQNFATGASSQNFNSGGAAKSFAQAAPGGVSHQNFATGASSQNFNSGGAAKSFAQAAPGGVSHQNFATGASSQNFNSGGAAKSFAQATSQAVSHQNFATGGFVQPSAQATAEASSQNFNSGGAQQAFAQATSQSSSATHGGQQFFQVLGPSSFVNTRSDSAVIASPRENEGFVMPHMQSIPVSDLLHDMETDTNRFPRSGDLKSGITHSDWEKDPLVPHKEEMIDDDSTDAKKPDSFADHKAQFPIITLNQDKMKVKDKMGKNSREKRDTAKNSPHIESAINKNDTDDKLDSAVGKQGPNSLLLVRNDEAKVSKLKNDKKGSKDSVLEATKVDSVEASKTTEMTSEVSNNFDHEMVKMINPDDLATTEITTSAIPADVDAGHSSVISETVEIATSEHSPIGQTSEASSDSVLGISRNSFASENKRFEADGTVDDDSHSNEDSSEENKNHNTLLADIVLPLINSTLPGESLTNLTVEQIEDIQFRIPDNGTGFPDNITMNKATENGGIHELNQAEDKVADSRRNSSFPFRGNGSKIVFDPSGAPFDSIEAEMSVLTNEEKEAFIQQEMKLISEVIEETLKNDQFWGTGLKGHNKTQGAKEEPSKDDSVSSPNLFQDFQRNNHKDYQRSVRAASPFRQDFDSILGAHKEKIDNIQKEATDDDDLLMISFIGDSVIKDLENRRDQVEHNMNTEEGAKLSETSSVRRAKRSVPATRLISDPTTKVDVPKTLDNVESVVWHTFENPQAPMYHVRKMLGNAKNVIMSAAKVPPNNVLVPSQYEIAKVSEDNGDKRLGAINQQMLVTGGSFGDVQGQSGLTPMDSLQKIGGVVRESVQTGKNVVVHANEAVTDARNVLYSVKHAAPRLIVPGQVPVIASRSFDFDVNPVGRKAMVITPKLLDVQENVVGAKEDQDKQFVGLGNILDAVGLTKTNPPEVEMKKIVLEPSAVDVLKQWDKPTELRSSSAVNTWTMDNLKNDKYLRKTDTLGAAQPEGATGTKTLKEFFNKMHQEMKEILTSQHEERKKKRKQMTRKPNHVNKSKKDLKLSKKKPVDGILGLPKKQININRATEKNYPTLPPDILDIFADNNFSDTKQRNSDSQSVNYVDTNKLEANKTVSNSKNYEEHNISNTDTKQNGPYSIYNANNETVALFLTPELLKPFMGQPSEDVVHNYFRDSGDEITSRERTIYPLDPLNKNITIPLSERGEPLFNLTSLVPNAEVSERTGSPRNGDRSRLSYENTSDFSKVTFPSSPKADPVDNFYKTENKQDPKALRHNIKLNNESTADFQKDLIPKGRSSALGVNHGDDLGHVLGAINPMMFERYFNESLELKHSNAQSTTGNPVLGDINPTRIPNRSSNNKFKELIVFDGDSVADEKQHVSPKSEGENVENSNETGRTSLKIINIYQKPFMGYMSKKMIRGFLNKYNNNLAGSSEEAERKMPQQKEYNDPVKNIIFTDNYDFDPYM